MKTNIYLYSSFCNYFCLIYFFWTYLKACKTVFCYKFFLVLFVAFLNSNVSEHHLKSLHAFYTIYVHVSRWCRGLFLLETFHFVSFIFFPKNPIVCLMLISCFRNTFYAYKEESHFNKVHYSAFNDFLINNIVKIKLPDIPN